MSQLDFAKQIVRSTHRISKQSGFDDLAAISALRDGRLAQILQGVSLINSINDVAQRWLTDYRSQHAYDISISNRDTLYPVIHEWLLRQMAADDRKSLQAVTIRGGALEQAQTNSNPYLRADEYKRDLVVAYQYDGRRDIKILINGHRVSVSIDKDDPLEGGAFQRKNQESKVVFSAKSLAGQQQVMRVLADLAKRISTTKVPSVYSTGSWEDWVQTGNIITRYHRTVILKQGQYERISADLRQFLQNESLYTRIGIPYHRGYLLYGEAGTGKTSTVLALAQEFGMDVYSMTLTNIKSDADLVSLFSSIDPRSILLMEDIDVSDAATKLSDEGKVTAEGLLNILDGAVTPKGLVVFMTTNNIQDILPSIKRPGRCDLTEEITHLDDDQMQRLVTMMTGVSGALPPLNGRVVTAAEIAEVVKKRITNLPQAHRDVVEYLQEKTQDE